MNFGILGPLEVSSEGGPIPLGGGRQRALLAVLLLRPNEVVSSERLLEELWGEARPATATKVVQLYVSRLRKRLGDGVLLTRAPGYVLRVDPDGLDAHRFEGLYEQGRRARDAGNSSLAAAKLREALGLWRGPALADFLYEPFAQQAIVRLEELRLAAVEARIEVDLVLGRHAELVGELEALVAEHPLREHPRGQLMLALYRSGRQAEALAAYQETRTALVEELGIEPSPALQDLERAILNQEAGLELPPVTGPPLEAEIRAEEPLSVPPPAFEPAEERKVATAVFADLVGSTEVGEGDPERTHLMLERFYDAMTAEVEAAGGTVEKLAGDAVIAVFGVPAAHEDHAERALHAAVAMRDRVGELFGDTHSLRVGVDTGEVVAAVRRREGSALASGNAVNMAARLEQAAAPGEILVGERTAAVAGAAFAFGEPMVADAKGRPGGVQCRRLVRELLPARPRGVAALRPAFIGREGELQLLRATYRRAVREKTPHFVTITGEAGVGKTTLVRALWEQLEEETPKAGRFTGRCLAYGRGITYWPLGEILRQHLGLLEGDPPDALHERLGAQNVLGLTLGLDVAGGLHPLEAREQLHAAWVALLGELAAQQPCVLLFEDLHWAEEPLLELIERLLRDVQGPVFLLGTARPELLSRRSAWAGGRRNAASLWLEPLTSEETARLVEALLGAELHPSLSELVLARAEGNPFFVEELLATLIDSGVIERQNGGWVVRDLPSGLVVPDSVQATLASRIDLLPAREKAALQAASVAGRIFWAAPVAELLGEEPDFALLEERDFVRRRSASTLTGEREYTVKHALTREVAYASLPKGKRARLHAGFAAWLERVGEGRDEHAPFLAHHYAEAVRPEEADLAWAGAEGEHDRLRDKAGTWLRRAADLAVARYAIDEALALLHRALELEPDESVQAELWLAIGQASGFKYDGEGLFAAMEKTIALSTDRQMTVEVCSELAYQTATRYGMWRRRPDAQLVDAWIERALELTEGDQGPDRVKALTARAYWDPSQEGAARQARALAERLGVPSLRQAALSALIEVALAAGRYSEALAHVSAELQQLPEITNPDERSWVHWNAVTANLGSGRIDEARRHALLHDEILNRLTPHQIVHGIGILLLVEEHAGRWNEIRALLTRVEPAVAANADTPCVLNPRMLLASALAAARAGDDAGARRLENAAAAIEMEGYGLTIDAPRLQLALLRDDLEIVERLLELPVGLSYTELAARAARLDALAALRDRRRVEDEAVPLLRPDTYLEPFALRALGVVREDVELVEQATERFEAMGLDWHAAETRRLSR